MYRIELKPGEESVFRTIEELAIGIRNGLITSRARIYHNASQKWLPIEFHPHYKKALEMPAATSGERPAVGVASPRASAHAPAPAPVPVAAGASRRSSPGLVFVEVEAPEIDLGVAEVPVFDSAVPSPVGELPHITYSESARASARRPRPLYLGVAAAVLMAGAYVAVSAALPSRKTAAEQAPARQIADVAAPVVQKAPVDSAPARNSASVPPSSNGPTFGGDPVAQSASRRPVTTSIGASPAATPHANSDSIEPPPVNVDLSIPSLPQGDSLAPVSTNDSNAMRRILRAVGGKGAPAAPVQP